MIRRPPRSTLFPYTRSSDLLQPRAQPRPRAVPPQHGAVANGQARRAAGGRVRPAQEARSEEHTSELQSQSNLVCRLLLEKKKKTKTTHYYSLQRFQCTE